MRAQYVQAPELISLNNNTLRRFDHQNLHSRMISRIPGLNPDCPELSRAQIKEFRTTKWCKDNGEIDLLTHKEFHPSPTTKENARSSAKQAKTQHTREISSKMELDSTKSSEEETEIPIVDQIINKTDSKKTLRPELLPVDDKMKLYFAYNRRTGTISRVIATGPRKFKLTDK